MEVSGSALLRTLKAVLDDASNALRRGEEDDDEAGLERVALGLCWASSSSAPRSEPTTRRPR